MGILNTMEQVKAVKEIVQIVHSALYNLIDAEKGTLPIDFRNDNYIIAYIYGIIANIFDPYKIKDNSQMDFLTAEVYENLFQGYGKNITDRCNNLIAIQDEFFLTVFKKALSEVELMYSTKDEKKLSSLTEYINVTYEV